MAKRIITHAHIVSPGVDRKDAAVVLDGQKIQAILPPGTPLPHADEMFDAENNLLVPGFIDIHTHGARGKDVTDSDDDAVETVAKAKLEEGCTSFAPTTLTLDEAALRMSVEHVAAYRKAGTPYAKALGVHLEGPFINPSCLGAQNPAFVRKPDIAEVLRLASVANVTQVTFAAEMEGGVPFARACLENGIVPSCGHSKATYEEFRKAYDAGLRHLTHFCNQMTPLHHRDIGLVGAGFLHGDVRTEVICDKIHLCPQMLRLVFSLRPRGSILMITDSMRASHLPDGPSSLGGLDVIVKDGQARLASNGALAGSVLRMNIALKNVWEVTGLPLCELIQCTSWNQAVELGQGSSLGKVEAGYQADLTLLDPVTFAVKKVFVDGRPAFSAR